MAKHASHTHSSPPEKQRTEAPTVKFRGPTTPANARPTTKHDEDDNYTKDIVKTAVVGFGVLLVIVILFVIFGK